MKLTIDENTFNEAVENKQLQVASWLIDKGCPINHACYVLANDLETLEWLHKQGIQFKKGCLADIINVTDRIDIIQWFLSHGATVDSGSVDACILRGKKELFEMLITSGTSFTVENFRAGVMSENTDILDFLKSKGCAYDDSVAEAAMKYKKKASIRWLVLNNYI